MTTTAQTPIIKQYTEMKKKHPDAVLLFRVGDFYECFREDAITASDILGITLTRRNVSSGPIELAGFPHHALDSYLPKLVRAGKRVAICEQLEDPKLKKNLVKRGDEPLRPGCKRLSNGLIIGPRVELNSKGFHDIDGRFMIHDDKVGIFMSEPNNRWFFAPLILSPYDEKRYKLYTELSWQYSEWIWIDEYEEEKLPEYYEEMKALYRKFVKRYGALHAPENAAFIKLDAYSDNLDELENKVVDKDGNVRYVRGKGFKEIEERLPHKAINFDFSLIFCLLTAFSDILNKLYIFETIRRKTKEIHALSRSLGLSPKKAFECCNLITQPSLFNEL